jgi:hypothetical protein
VEPLHRVLVLVARKHEPYTLTLNPELVTANLEPYTLNPELVNANLEPYTLNPEP